MSATYADRVVRIYRGLYARPAASPLRSHQLELALAVQRTQRAIARRSQDLKALAQ